MSTLVIILARAGSKGVPGKNVALVGGRACIEWTLDHAISGVPDGEIVVSTDCPRAAEVGRQRGATIVERPAELAHDRATIDDAARHAVSQIAARAGGPRPKRAVILYANVPVRPAGLVERAIEMLRTTGCDSVQSYQPVGKYHPWWTARLDPASASVGPWEGDVLNHNVFRRQDLPPAFIPDGGVIALTTESLMLEIPNVAPGPHAFFGRDRRGVINPEGSVIDIDSPIDLVVANAVLTGAVSHQPSAVRRQPSDVS